KCVVESESVLEASAKLADPDVGAMPICGEDGRLKGMLTDRDILVKVLAARVRTRPDLRGRAGSGQAGDDRGRRFRRGGGADDDRSQGSPSTCDRRSQPRYHAAPSGPGQMPSERAGGQAG